MNRGAQNTFQKGNKEFITELIFANDSLSRHMK